jgi:hypothetical protein
MSIKLITHVAIGIGLGWILSGCSGMNAPLPPKEMSCGELSPIELKYVFKDEIQGNEILEKDVVNVLSSTMSSLSKYTTRVTKRNQTRSTYGQQVMYQNNSFVIDYFNGDFNCHDCPNRESVTRVLFSLSGQIKQLEKNAFALNMKFPSKYTILGHTNAVGLEHKTLDAPANLEQDAKKIYSSLKSTPLIIKRTVQLKGEINSKYPDKSIYTNFTRKLGDYNWGNWKYGWYSKEQLAELKKQNTFSLNVNGKILPLLVEVYPYRDGSKVVYSSVIEYEIDSNGGATLNQASFEALHKQVADIVND